MSPASFNYYQECEREVQDIAEPQLRQAYETGEPLEVYRVLEAHALVPWGVFAGDTGVFDTDEV